MDSRFRTVILVESEIACRVSPDFCLAIATARDTGFVTLGTVYHHSFELLKFFYLLAGLLLNLKPDLSTTICGLCLRNPIIAASGTFGYGVEFEKILHIESIGGFVTKGISLDPIVGNPAPRLYETTEGMINSVGLQNIGVRAFVQDKVPRLASLGAPAFVNVFGYSVEDYCETVRVLEDAPNLAGYELNVSCPNTKCGGMFFSTDPAMLASVVEPVRRLAKRPVIVKLSPNVAAIEPLALASERSGADAISLVNTFLALAVDARNRTPRVGNGMGGLSGAAIKPIALRMVWQAAKAVKIPVIGLGGISTGEDAAEFLVAGAHAVEVGTASFWDPRSTARIARELEVFLKNERIASISSLIGTLRL